MLYSIIKVSHHLIVLIKTVHYARGSCRTIQKEFVVLSDVLKWL